LLEPGAAVLRPVTAGDAALLFDVYASTRSEELAVTGWTEERRQAFLAMQFHAQQSDYTSRFPDAEHSIIAVDGADVGRIWVNRSPSEIRLLDIALLAQSRNRGIGTDLLRSLIEEAEAAALPLRHSVYKANDRALRFYGRLGFTIVEDFETYVLMERSDHGAERVHSVQVY
jgi:ribosomal protein S18 acetylase RimI-like enzyme